MARSHLAVALGATCIAVLATLALLQQFHPLTSISWAWTGSRPNPFSNKIGQQILAGPKDGTTSSSPYLLGAGKADITGPVVEINFMGYADPAQLGSGVRQRLYSRAFIIGSPEKPSERIAYLVLDTQSGDTAVRHGILEGLESLGPEYAVYGQQNVAITGTHSHSGPGAWLNYLLPQITSRGFSKQSYEAIVDGAIESIRRAHESLAPGRLTHSSVEILDANLNRSPFAYLANPSSERSRYKHNVDKDMTMLRFHRESDDKDIGVLTWFPVHGTSMLGNNTLVTGDNKGVAAHLFETYAKESSSAADDGFVAGFSQANVGDTTPNVLGAYCEFGDDEGLECDFKTSLCAGKNGPCHGRGPHWGLDDAGTASAYEIGKRQYLGARNLYESMLTSETTIRGDTVSSLHSFVDFANRTFVLPNGTSVRTCPAALGYSFAAGTSDGPGAFDFKQNNPGDPNANPLWSVVGNQLHKPGPEQMECHGVKPILLDVGETERPYRWSPNIVDIQLLRVGQLYIIVSPGEATTMAGRRWKAALQSAAALDTLSSDEPLVVLGGPANTYTHYITTEEEYGIQRYEGASTLYGPHTLAAYIDLTVSYLPYLFASKQQSPRSSAGAHLLPALPAGPSPPIYVNDSLSFITPVIVDRAGLFQSFGNILTDVAPSYTLSLSRPVPTIAASFIGACPRNNLRLGDSFAAVERWDDGRAAWVRVRDDADWSLVFEWRRTSTALGTSVVSVRWEMGWEGGVWGRDAGFLSGDDEGDDVGGGDDGSRTAAAAEREKQAEKMEALKGRYRLRYFGDWKALGGTITPFEAASGEFLVV